MIDESKLALPQFQRPSVWGKSNWIPFLLTVLQGRPAGTLLLLQATDGNSLAPRELETAPSLIDGELEWLLLDGQQRTTTLYRAIRTSFGKSGQLKKIVIDVKRALDRGELTEDDVAAVAAGSVAGFAEMARQGKADFATLTSSTQLAGWQLTFVNENFNGDAPAFIEAVERVIPGLLSVSSYRFPVLQIKHDTPLDVVADIFEGMNRRGQPLNKFDLMVARLYQRQHDGSYYNLRESWQTALSNSPNLQQLGVGESDGMLPLQLIAKQVSRLPAAIRGRVKGLTSGDVLEVNPEQVIGSLGATIPDLDLPVAVRALDDAASFLITTCGVVGPSLLPQQAMLLPLADQYLRPAASRLTKAQLKKWFFSVGLSIDYYGSVNSYADRDCNRLVWWVEDQRVPESVEALDRQSVEKLDLDMPFTREGNILGRTIMALLVSNGALDWASGQIQVKSYDSVDFHHMIPEQRLKTWFPKSTDDWRPISGLTPVWSTTNRSIGNKNSADVIKDLGNDAPPTIASHHADTRLLEAGWRNRSAFKQFRIDRERRLKQFIISALGL